MRWMIDGQLGRRNLTPIQRVAVTEKYRPTFEEKAKENISKTTIISNKNRVNPASPISAKLEQKIDTRNEMAKLAGVSHDTYDKGRKILQSGNEEVKQKVLSGDMSINAGYNEIFINITMNISTTVLVLEIICCQLKNKSIFVQTIHWNNYHIKL